MIRGISKHSCLLRCFQQASRRTDFLWARIVGLAGLLGTLACISPAPTWAATDNGGLGLLPIGDQFPPKLQFLIFTPEPVLALPDGTLSVTYQFSDANTALNTQQTAPPRITQATINGGLTTANFPATGYAAFIQMETQRNLFKFRYGLGEGWELGLDQAWISFGAGGIGSSLDRSVESALGAKNPERWSFSANRFEYFVTHNGRFLVDTHSPVDNVPQDPVVSLKWNLSEGGELLPALSLRVAYKAPLDSAKSLPRSLVSSGHDDWGYSVLISKAVGRWVAHFQLGESFFGGEGRDYVQSLNHQFFGLEYRANSRNSVVFQTSSELTVFNVGLESGRSSDFAITRPGEMVSAGYRYAGETYHFDLGFSEDYITDDNTTDTVLFFDLGWKW